MSEAYVRCPECYINAVPVSPETSSATTIRYVCDACFSRMCEESKK